MEMIEKRKRRHGDGWAAAVLAGPGVLMLLLFMVVPFLIDRKSVV